MPHRLRREALAVLRELSTRSAHIQVYALLTVVYFVGIGGTWMATRIARQRLLPFMSEERAPSYWIRREPPSEGDHWKRMF